jgi:hypothetical protein
MSQKLSQNFDRGSDVFNIRNWAFLNSQIATVALLAPYARYNDESVLDGASLGLWTNQPGNFPEDLVSVYASLQALTVTLVVLTMSIYMSTCFQEASKLHRAMNAGVAFVTLVVAAVTTVILVQNREDFFGVTGVNLNPSGPVSLYLSIASNLGLAFFMAIEAYIH